MMFQEKKTLLNPAQAVGPERWWWWSKRDCMPPILWPLWSSG